MKRKNTYTTTVFSNRMYGNEKEEYTQIIDENFKSICNKTMMQYNKIMFSVYNLLYLKEMNPQKYKKIVGKSSIYKYVIKRFGINVYYANSIINQAKGIVDSQITLNKDYKEQKEEQIKTIHEKMNKRNKELSNYIFLRNNLKTYKRQLQENPESKIQLKGIKNLTLKPDEVIVRYNSKKQKILGYGEFEYKYLNPRIKKLKFLISMYKYRVNNLKNKMNNLEKIKPITFRNNRLKEMNKEKDNLKKEKLKKLFLNSKYYRFQISGVNNAKYGNYIFKMIYIPVSDDFDMIIKFPDKEIRLSHIDFPYKKEEIIKLLEENNKVSNKKKEPLCFELIRKMDTKRGEYYYQFKLTLNLLANKRINESTDTGIVGLDFNYGHIDLSDIDEKGNMVNNKTIYYDLTGTSKQNELSLRQALNEVGEYVKSKHKCLVIEDLNMKQSKYKFNTDKKDQKKLNKIIHSLPVALYKQAVDYTGLKYEFAVYYVKPSYTSIIGRLKYVPLMKLNSHISASYVIARCGLGYKEHLTKTQMAKIPLDLKSVSLIKKWSYLNKQDKKKKKQLSSTTNVS